MYWLLTHTTYFSIVLNLLIYYGGKEKKSGRLDGKSEVQTKRKKASMMTVFSNF
jgi:hypothetical protein